ncbi:hypothetical protein D3C79_978420 [compost metagenome]
MHEVEHRRPSTGQCLNQAVQPQGLEQAIIHARRTAALALHFGGTGRQADQLAAWPAAAPFVLPDSAGQGVTIKPGHVAVADHPIEVFSQP